MGLSPKGAAILYARPERQSLVQPLVVSWGYHPAPEATTSSTYLDLLQWTGTHDSAAAHFTGSAGQQRVPAQFLEETFIPVPSLPEQHRIVARIEAFAQRLEETLNRLNQLEYEFDALCRSVVFDPSDGDLTPTPMRELVRLRSANVIVQPAEIYALAWLKSFRRGVFKGPVKSGAEFTYPRLTRLRAGEFVYPKLMAWEGAFGVVPPECDGLVVSTEFPVFEINQEKVLPETLDVYFRTPSVWPMILEISTGTNARRKRLHPSALLAYDDWRIVYGDEPQTMFERMIGSNRNPKKPAAAPASSEQCQMVYRFKAHLVRRPKIWREIEIQGKQTLADLDLALRGAFNHDEYDHLGGF